MVEHNLAKVGVAGSSPVSRSHETSDGGRETRGSVLLPRLLSEVTSNTASANMIVPVVISIAVAANVDPVVPALGATMGASLGFMLPVSTPCNAIVYGSGYIKLKTMMRYGIVVDIVGVIVIVALVKLILPFAR